MKQLDMVGRKTLLLGAVGNLYASVYLVEKTCYANAAQLEQSLRMCALRQNWPQNNFHPVTQL